ncbi:MAG: nucleotide exchange factor GrpE [Candidatus Yanofskybacteria bacterium]|nr:nucleotide exchange factor GrpE [Candidatus Yanofskybacteria bacterium]
MEDSQNQQNTNQEAELDACRKQAEEYLNNWKRERADFVNYKKDEVKRMSELIKFGNVGLILELLEILDDLYLAAGETKNGGLDRILKKFEEMLKKAGVERIKTDGKFDPALHEAISAENALSGDGGGGKIEEIRVGYIMDGRVIRPARVRVAK